MSPGEEFTYKGPDKPDEDLFNGHTYRYDDRPESATSETIDVYDPDHPADKGVSQDTIQQHIAYTQSHIQGYQPGEHASSYQEPPAGSKLSAVPEPPAGSTLKTPAAAQVAPAPEEPQAAPQAGPQGVGPQGLPQAAQATEHPITQDQMDANQAQAQQDPDVQNIDDENKRAAAIYDKTLGLNLDNHSANLVPTDQRVTRRINPDTGSNKIVGSYFVPGDPLHEDLLQNLDPAERAKLPWLSQAILRGGPFSYMYGSAQQEGGPAENEGERPTGESRAYEIGQSPAAQRISGEHQTQDQRVTMLPMQMMATMPKVDKPSNVLLEGLGSDAVMNNAQHLMNGAGQAKIPVPYNNPKDFNFQRDLMGFLENQVHGFKGDGSPMLDENGNPHPLHVANAKSQNPYIPNLLQRPQAEFLHAMLNIRPPKNPKGPLQPPGFGERASWQRRINEGYTGQPAGYNGLLNQLDQKLPEVGIRGKKGNITRTVPWSAGTLEPTWRAYRLELIRHGMPNIGTESMRGPVQSQLIHTVPHFRQTLAMYEPGRPAPISENPEVGGPAGDVNPAGGPGLLEQSASDEGAAPAPQQTFEAISPSVKEEQTYAGAKRALNRPAHSQFRDFSSRVENGLAQAKGVQPASQEDTIGDWNDGAENTLATESQGHDYEDRRVAAAIKAHHAAQKQALLFRHHDEGPHSLYRLALNTDNEEEARDLLTKAGIGVRTLYPASKGRPVHAHVADLSEDGKLLPVIEGLIKKGHVQEAWHHEGTGELIGDQNGESRAAAAQAYRGILREAKSRWDQARPGGAEGEDDRARGNQAPWWDSFAREAEENYQKLAQTQELKNQQRALAIKSAKAHREDVPLERQRMLQREGQKAKDWVKNNPETEELSAHHFLDKHETLPESVEKNEHVGEFFDARNPKLDYDKAEDRSKAAKALTHDVMHALSNNSSALGWYGETVRKAFDKFSEIAPELKTDKASNLAFRIALAVTSQGQDVFANAGSAWKVYQYWKEHGTFPTDKAKEIFGGGIKAPQMLFNFAKANRLWNQHGSAEDFDNWLGQTIRHGDLAKNYRIKVGSTLADAELPMSAVFGPKIGIFHQNLSGNEDPITMDLWFSRTMNRLAGNMFGFSPDSMQRQSEKDPGQLQSLRELLKSGQLTNVDAKTQGKMTKEIDRVMAVKNLTREKADQLMPTIRDWAQRQHKFYAETIVNPDSTKRSYHPDRATAENLNAKNIDENFKALQGDPRNGTERANWIKVMDEVRGNMQKAGINITNADRQALLWFLEQRLFQGATGAKETSHDYLDAAHDLVRKVKEEAL